MVLTLFEEECIRVLRGFEFATLLTNRPDRQLEFVRRRVDGLVPSALDRAEHAEVVQARARILDVLDRALGEAAVDATCVRRARERIAHLRHA